MMRRNGVQWLDAGKGNEQMDKDKYPIEETYTATAACRNCGTSVQLEPRRGTTVKQFLNSARCPNCGCATLAQNTVMGDLGTLPRLRKAG